MKSFLFYHATSQASVVIITIALMLFVGYLMTRITRKFKLPNVTGYILAGILMGPYCLDMVPVEGHRWDGFSFRYSRLLLLHSAQGNFSAFPC